MNVFTYDYLELNGRLGNQLWQIAAMVNFASTHDGIARFKEDWEYKPFFNVPESWFDWDGVPQPHTKVDGGTMYFQEYSYFSDVKRIIRMAFEPSARARKEVQDNWCARFPNLAGSKVCAIHVRRGDYVNLPDHFPLCTSKYYTDAVADVKSRIENVAFIVFSDDIQWCKDNLDFFGFGDSEVKFAEGIVRPVEVNERVGEPQDWLDLFTMNLCDEHIISNSTFAWWGAYLSKNTTPIYPSKWWGPLVPNSERWELAMPEGWRRFEC